MEYREYGEKYSPTIVLIHGETLGPWSYHEVASLLSQDYHVIVPTLKGHGVSLENFVSIEDSSLEIENFIQKYYEGHIYAMAGFSVGGQIVLNILSHHERICEFAIIESIDILEASGMISFMQPLLNVNYTLLKQKWFAKIQSDSMHVPKHLFDYYYRDVSNISKETLTQIIKESYRFTMPYGLKKCRSHTLILFGEKESHAIKKSSRLISQKLSYSQLYQLKKMGHGEFFMTHPKHYITLLKRFFKNG